VCGAKTCVDIADFAAANEGEVSQIVDLPHGAPSHDSFSRLFRLLDPVAEPSTKLFETPVASDPKVGLNRKCVRPHCMLPCCNLLDVTCWNIEGGWLRKSRSSQTYVNICRVAGTRAPTLISIQADVDGAENT
jgi:hypothetical protein